MSVDDFATRVESLESLAARLETGFAEIHDQITRVEATLLLLTELLIPKDEER